MLETQLPVEPLLGRLRLGRGELVARRDGARTLSSSAAVWRRSASSNSRIASRAEAASPAWAAPEESPEEVVQSPVLPRHGSRPIDSRLRDPRPRFFHAPHRERMDRVDEAHSDRRASRRRRSRRLASPAARRATPSARPSTASRKRREARDAAGRRREPGRRLPRRGRPGFGRRRRDACAATSPPTRSSTCRSPTSRSSGRPRPPAARFRAEFSGQPRKLGGLDRFLPSASTYDFDVRLVPDGSRWKVAFASWEVVGGRS